MKLSPADVQRVRVAAVGWIFGIGTLTVLTPSVSVADPVLWAAAVLILRHRRPPFWLALLAGTVALGATWSANPAATAYTAARILSVGVVSLWLLRNWDARAFAAGLVLSWAIQVPYLIYGIVVPDASWVGGGRQVGLTRYATILGTGAYFVHMAIPVNSRWIAAATWAVGAIALAASGARAPAGALGVYAIASGRLVNVALVGLTAVVFIFTAYQAGTTARLFDPGNIEAAVIARVGTAAPDKVSPDVRAGLYGIAAGNVPVGVSTWRPQGVGAGAYLDANPWPRPHNVYSILWHELGVLSAVPAGVFAWALYRRRITAAAALSLAALGLLDDTVISQVEGHFILAGVLVLSAAARRQTSAPARAARAHR